MSAKLMGAVWDLDLSHPKQSVMLALADHAHDDGTKCYPSIDYLAWKTGYDRRNVQRVLRELENDELIVAVGYKGGGRHATTEYVLDLSAGTPKPVFNPGLHKLTPKRRSNFLAMLIGRDGAQCSYCGGEGDEVNAPDGKAWHIDRVIPGAAGPGYVEGNVALSCGTCNRNKKDGNMAPFGSGQRVPSGDKKGGDTNKKGGDTNKKGGDTNKKGGNSPRAKVEEPSYEPSVEPSKEEGARERPVPDDTTSACLLLLKKVKGLGKDYGELALLLGELRQDFPGVDAVATCKEYELYHRRPPKPTKNHALKLRRFFANRALWNERDGPGEPSLVNGSKDGEKDYGWLERRMRGDPE